nr:daz interacting protein 1 [Hymenolepis microstoma]
MSGFFFRKRVERIDWKRLASVDVRKVASQVDIDVLQENLFSVAFCDIDAEIDTRYVDTNLVKLFQLAQLLIEYLLYSQDYLTGTVDSLRRENENIKKETELLRKRLDEQAQRLTTTRKECHRRRLLLLAQQRLMNNGPQSYFRCPHCPKAFINASFLNAHLFRRHTEVVAALQNVDLNTPGLLHQSFACEVSPIKKKAPVEQHQATLSTNLEQQIKEVLDHVQTQILPPSQLPPPPAVSSAFVQTSARSPDSVWKNRAAELERQLKEEREQLIQLEERNRTWQEAITSQHKVDVERVREMFEVELRNLREENLEKQKELLQLRIKGAIPLGFGDLEDDVPRQLERQVKSLERDISVCQVSATIISTPQSMLKTESENSEALSLTETYTLPSFKMVNNANKAGVEDSLTTLERLKMLNESSLCDEAFTLCSEASESSKKQPQTQKISRRDIYGRCKGVCTPVIRTENTPSKVKFERENQVTLPLVSLKWVEKKQKLKTEEESEQTAESIHLVPFVIPASNNKTQTSMEASPKRGRYQPRVENRIVQIVDDDDYSIKHAKERLRQSSSAEKVIKTEPEKAEKSLQASEPQMRANALEGIPHYKVQLKEFRANPSVMRRFRDEAESQFEEQLIDHNVEPNAKGLSGNKSNELTDILGQERLHLARKFPNFWEIRESLSRKVDHLAFQAFHSKREYTSSSPNRDEKSSFKRARSSRASERGRPPSGRPSSLTSLGTILSPIAEHHHGATAPPTVLRRPAGANQAQSKQSLFENSGNEDDDVVEVNRNKKDEKVTKGGRSERTTKKSSQPLNDFEDSDDDLGEGEERVHDESSASPGPPVNFYGKNRRNVAENEDLDYRFVRRAVDDDDDDDYLEIVK